MSIVRAPSVNPDGTIGIRGYRALCHCLWLGPVVSYRQAARHLAKHRLTCEHKPR